MTTSVGVRTPIEVLPPATKQVTAPDMSPVTSTSSDRGGRRNTAILITGAGGEVGHGLIAALKAAGRGHVVAIDIRELEPSLRDLCQATYVGDICDRALLERLLAMYE